MDTLVLFLMLTFQTADAAYTCHGFRQGWVEANPLAKSMIGNSCARVVAIKASTVVGSFLVPKPYRKWVQLSFAVSGGVGFGVSIALTKD